MNETPFVIATPDQDIPPLLPSEVLGVLPVGMAEAGEDAPLDAYYDSNRKEYLVQNSGGRWLSLGDAGFRRILRSKGYSATLSDAERAQNETLSEVEREILRLQDTRDVKFCGPLAGRRSGFYDENGARFLVTESPRLIEPSDGDWPLISGILAGLLAGSGEGHGETQLEVIIGWLASAAQSLYSGKRQPGQALVLAGPAACGKSVLQNEIITPLLGGRSAKCALYVQGKTNFNGELFGAKHLMLEDEQSETRIKSRLALAAHIKQICVNAIQPCHAKHRPIINLSPFWRLTISVNDEPERLLIIPPLARDVEDKLILLRCHPFQWPRPVGSTAQWAAFTSALRGEFPAFLNHLLNHSIKNTMHSDRYGIKAWHHPELVRAIEELSPEAHLALIISRWFPESSTVWTGTADELRTRLFAFHETDRDARELLNWPNACGTYIARLQARPRSPLTVIQRRSTERREWEIRLGQT